MKIEIIKETKVGGEVFFIIHIDGYYSKCFLRETEAREYVEVLKKFKTETKEIIHTEEI
jgi:hypothetical protein